MWMGATSSDAWGGVGYDLAEVFRGNRTALVGGISIVVERHEAVLFDNGIFLRFFLYISKYYRILA